MDWYTYWADRLKPEYELREVPRGRPRAWWRARAERLEGRKGVRLGHGGPVVAQLRDAP